MITGNALFGGLLAQVAPIIVTSIGIPDTFVPPDGDWDITGDLAVSGSIQCGTLIAFNTSVASVGTAASDAYIGALFVNPTAAAAGAQQYSPLLIQEAQGWKTDATAATREVQMGTQVRAVEGAANPTGAIHWLSNINDGGFTSIMNLTSAGALAVATINCADIVAAASVQAASIVLTASANMVNNALFSFGSSGDWGVRFATAQTPDSAQVLLPATSNAIIFQTFGTNTTDWGHVQQTNPTIYIHSASTTTTHWISFTHDQTNAVITCGLGDLVLSPASDVAILSGKHLQLGNAYSAEAFVATGVVQIKDSTGTAYKVGVVAA